MQGAASRFSSKHGNATEAPGKERESRAATNERLESMEKNQTQVDTAIIELDSAKDAQVIEESGPDNTHPANPTTHNNPESVPPPPTQDACQSQRDGSRCEPEARVVRPLSAHMPIISPISQHKDPLDDILEALLKDCNSNVAGSGSASRAISSNHNIPVSEEARIPDTIQENTRVPAHDFIDSVYDKDARNSASSVSRDPRSASLQQASALGGPRSMHTPSTGSLYYPNRLDLGCFQGHSNVPTQNRVGSRNAWNDYGNIYQRPQYQADLRPDSGEHVSFYAAMRDDLSGPSQMSNQAIAPYEHAQNFLPVELSDDSDNYKPHLHKTLREWDDHGNHEEITHGECHDRLVDTLTRQDSGVTTFDESRKGCDDGIMAESDMSDYQEVGINADDEQSIVRDADQHEVGHRLFTPYIPGTRPALGSHGIFDRDYGVKRCPTDAQVHKHDVEPPLSGFWTPHKLY